MSGVINLLRHTIRFGGRKRSFDDSPDLTQGLLPSQQRILETKHNLEDDIIQFLSVVHELKRQRWEFGLDVGNLIRLRHQSAGFYRELWISEKILKLNN